MHPLAVPDTVRRKAVSAGAGDWLERLPHLLAGIERDWRLVAGQPFGGGHEALVVPVTLADGTPAVLKLPIPGDPAAVRNEIMALQLAAGEGCALLLRADPERGAFLLERLGPTLRDLDLPLAQSRDILCATVAPVWRPVAASGLPTGAEKARWLTAFIAATWEETGRPCSERAVDQALQFARCREAAHDDERAVLVHGDVHATNALQTADGTFKLVDPDGLLAEPEYDLGVILREHPADPDPMLEAQRLAARTGLDATATWEWSVVERLSSGLLCTSLDFQPTGREWLAAADAIAARR